MTLVHSILTYCSPVWRPYLLNDINSLEKIQHHATKINIFSLITLMTTNETDEP